jgi:hypothetical protein
LQGAVCCCHRVSLGWIGFNATVPRDVIDVNIFGHRACG